MQAPEQQIHTAIRIRKLLRVIVLYFIDEEW